MITRIMLVFMLAFGLLGHADAQKQKTGPVVSQSAQQSADWKCVKLTCSKDIQDPDMGPLHIRVQRKDRNQIVFTVMAPCPLNNSSTQSVSWTKGDSWARGRSCNDKHMSIQVTEKTEKKFDPLPRRMGSETPKMSAEKLT
jgi:hypothetical protein